MNSAVKKIKQKDYYEWEVNYWKTFSNNHQRFGQAFCNHFNITDDSIFYDPVAESASMKILEYYVDDGIIVAS